MKVDFANAFNSVSRRAMLRELYYNFPELYRWARYCYEGDSHLFFGEHTLRSSEGAQQGDPIGPLAFSLALHPIILELKKRFGLDLLFFYLDDGVLAGEKEKVAEAMVFLREESARIGLIVNDEKCEVVPLFCGREETTAGDLGLPGEFRVLDRDGFTLLGAPIGSPEYCEGFIRGKVAELKELFGMLGDMPDTQAAMAILRNCMGYCKIVHLIRVVGPELKGSAVEGFDGEVRQTVERLLGDSIGDPQWLQATLPIRMGGLGLRRGGDHGEAAYLSSVSSSLALCRRMDPAFDWERARAGYEKAVEGYNGRVAEGEGVDKEEPQNKLSQKALSLQVDEGRRRGLLDSLRAPTSRRGCTVWVCRRPGSGSRRSLTRLSGWPSRPGSSGRWSS